MTNNIVSIGGAIVPGTPEPEVVQILENLLAAAKRGEVIGLGVVTVSPEHTVMTSWTGALGTHFQLGYGVALLASRYLNNAERE